LPGAVSSKLLVHRSIWRMPDQDRRASLRRLETSFSQGAEWKALISKYIGTIPLSGDASCAAAQGMSGTPPPRTAVSSAMIANAGAVARHSQSAAPRVAALPIAALAPAVRSWVAIIDNAPLKTLTGGGREIDWGRPSNGGSYKCGGIRMDSLITAAARALAAGDPIGALNRVALRDDAPALALRP
jgi:hypothetical protein